MMWYRAFLIFSIVVYVLMFFTGLGMVFAPELFGTPHPIIYTMLVVLVGFDLVKDLLEDVVHEKQRP